MLTLERAAIRTLDSNIEVSEIIFMRSGRDSWCGIGDQTFGFLYRRWQINTGDTLEGCPLQIQIYLDDSLCKEVDQVSRYIRSE